jgi:hypothetical protein
MFRTAVLSTIFLSCAVLAGTSLGEAQTLDPATRHPLPNGHLWWSDGWGFTRPGTHRVSDPKKRNRLGRLSHMAHIHAAAQACTEVETVQKNIDRLFAEDGLGPLSPGELAFVGGRISDFKERLKVQAGEEVCEWAYENYGPKGAMSPGLVRSRVPRAREPETTSGLPRTRLR